MPGRLQLHQPGDCSPVGVEELIQRTESPQDIRMGVRHYTSSCRSDHDALSLSDRSNGRLGLTKLPESWKGVPYPIEVNIPGSRIVSLVAGGM